MPAKRGGSDGDPEQIDSIIQSVKQFKGFKQMAQYNLSTLVSHIQPPTVGWQANVRHAVESGGIEAIVDVLKQHPQALEVVRASIDNLRLLAVNTNNAGIMAKAGAISAALSGMQGDDQDLAESGAALLEQISTHNPDAVLDSEGSVEALLKGVKDSKNMAVATSCLSTLDRLGRTDRGEEQILKHGGIKAIVGALAPGKETSEDMLRPAFRLLERFARDDANLKAIKEAGGLEALVAQLEAHSDNDALLRAGGRLLARIAESDLENTIEKLKDSNLPPQTRDFMVALISNLALRPENVDKIIKNGGLQALVSGLPMMSPKTQEAAARALERMANSPEHVDAVIKAGGVEALVKVLESAGDNEDLRAAAIKALNALATNKKNGDMLQEKAGKQVLKSLKDYPQQTGQAAEAIRFFERLASLNTDVSPMVTSGLVKNTVDAMKSSPMDADVQLAGLRALERLMHDTYSSNGKTGIKASGELLGANGAPVLVSALQSHRESPEIAETGLQAMVELNQREPKNGPKNLTSAGAVPAMVGAVFDQSIAGNRAVDEPARQLLKKLVPVKSVADVVAKIKKHAANVVKGGSKVEEDVDALEDALMSVLVYAKLKSHADAMHKAGIIPALLSTMKDVLQVGNQAPRHDWLMGNYAYAIGAVARADRKYLTELTKQGVVDRLVESLKQLPDQVNAVVPTLRTMKVFAAAPESKRTVVEGGGIEGCVSAMRTNASSSDVFVPALEAMLQLSTSDEFAAAVAQKGGTRQLIKGLTDNCTDAGWERPTEVSLMLLERVASAGAEHKTVPALVKQGAVDAVIRSMEAFPRNETIEAVGARVLAKLLDRAGVEAAVDEMAKAAKNVRDEKDPAKATKKLPDLSRAMATVGFLALAEDNTPIMKEKNAPGIVLDALKTVDKLPESNERTQARRAGFRALGQIASNQPLDPDLNATGFVLDALRRDDITAFEKVAILDSIKSMAASETAAKQLVQGGAVKDIMKMFERHPHDEAIAASAFGALGALGEHKFGAEAITKEDGAGKVHKWLRDNAEIAGPRAIEEAMTLLSNLALLEQNAKALHQNGIVDQIIAALDSHCNDPSDPHPRVLNAAVTLLGRLANDKESIEKLAKTGVLGRVIKTAQSSPAYLGDPEGMEALLFLLESCAMVPEVRSQLVHDGAVDMIMAAMNMNQSSEDVVMTGGRALQTLLQSDPNTIKEILKEVSAKADKLKKEPADRETQEALATALQNMANLTLIDGLVDAAGAKEMAKVLVKVMDTIDSSMEEGPAKSRLLAQAATALGRLPLVQGGDGLDLSDGVKGILKMMGNNPEDETINEAALNALSNMLNSPTALKALSSVGGIDKIVKAMENFPDSERVHQAGTAALQKARAIVQASPKNAGGMDTEGLASLMKAHAGDSKGLREMLSKLAGSGGMDNLLSLLGSDNMSPDMLNELLQALRDAAQNQGMELHFTDPKQIQGLLRALQGLDPNGKHSAADRAAALERQKNALKLLGAMDSDGLKKMVAGGAIESLLKMLDENRGDADLARQILNALNKMVDVDPDALSRLLQGGAAELVRDILAQHEDDKELVKSGVDLLGKMAKVSGIEKIGADEELVRLLNKLTDKFGDLGGGSLMDDLGALFKNEGSEMIGTRLENALANLDKADDVVEMHNDDGRVYYYNKTTGETSWEKPQAYAQVVTAFEGLAKLTEANKDNIKPVNPKALNAAVGHIKTHANEPSRLTALAKALAALATNDENRAAIAAAGGLQAIIQALNSDQIDEEFLEAAINLLNQFARHDEFKDQIAKLGGIKALIAIMLKFIERQDIVEKCLSALANLAFNSPANMAEIIKCEGVPAVSKVMKRWRDEPKVLQLAMVLLSNLMYGNDENKDIIGKQCGKDIVDVVNRHHKDAKVFKGALRAIGNLTFTDPNIRLVCGNLGATKCIVKGMESNPNDTEAQQIAIDVLGNFASLQEDDVEDKIARGEMQSIYDVIMLEGGGARIIKTVEETEEPQVLMAAMDALANLCNHMPTCDKLLRLGIAKLTIEALQKYDWDEALVERTVHLLATLTYNELGVTSVCDEDGIQLLLSALESHIEEPDFLVSTVIALKNIAGHDKYRQEIAKLQGVDPILHAFESNLAEKQLLVEIMLLLVRLSMHTPLSEQIAVKGMHVILKAIYNYKQDADFLTQAFILLGHLAFAPNNLKIISQYGGIKLVIDGVLNFPEKKELVTRSIQTLDNCAMGSQEQATIVRDAGGVKVIKEISAAYSDDPDVTACAKSALLSLTALETRAAKPRRQFMKQDNDADEGDPLANFRNMLRAGAVFTEWSSGGPHPRHLLVMPDWRTIAWSDPKKGAKRGMQLPIRDIRVIRSGVYDGHKRGRKKADPECSFSIVGRAAVVDLEARSPEEAQKWVSALQALLHTFKRDPKWLRG